MPDTITLVRPDGSLLDIDPKEAGPLLTSGYREESPDEYRARQSQIANERYWSSPTEKLKTAIEGAGSGLTLGLTDKLLEAWKGDEGDWKHRAEYNPGTRIAGEIGGAILGAIPSGGDSLAALTPTALLTRGAEVAGEATKLGRVGQAVVRGGVEGAGFGLGGEISHSALTGDPMTVEGTLAGMGWGAVFGGGISALGAGVTSHFAAKREAVEKAILAREAAEALTKEKWGGVREALVDSGEQINRGMTTAREALTDSSGRAQAIVNRAAEIRGNFFNEMTTSGMDKYLLAEKKAGINAFKNMEKALARKDYAALEENTTRFQEALDKIKSGRDLFQGSLPGAPEVPAFENPYSALSHQKAVGALEETSKLGVARNTLREIPLNPSEFAKMTTARAERLFGAVDTVMSAKAPEMVGLQEGLTGSIAGLQEHLGLATEGGPATQLRGIWEHLKAAESSAGEKTATEAAKGKLPWLRGLEARAGGIALMKATGAKGMAERFLAYQVGRQLASGLLGLKGAVLSAVNASVEKWGPRVGKAGEKAASRIEPLAVRLDGTVDRGKKERGQLMRERAEEIRNAAGSVRDTLYRSLAPLDIHHPEYAVGLHQKAVEMFQWLLDKLPKDPGNAYSKFQSIHTPDTLETEKFARYYDVFHDPVGVLQRALTTGHVTPEAAEGIHDVWGELATHLKVEMLDKMSRPGVLDKMSYQDQVRTGLLLGIPMHSSMTPQFIASQQQMYAERNQKLPMNPQPGMGSGGGRPEGPAKSPYASDAQKTTAH